MYLSLLTCSKWPSPAWTTVLTQNGSTCVKLRETKRVSFCYEHGYIHPPSLLSSFIFWCRKYPETLFGCMAFSQWCFFFLLLQGRPPSKKAKVLNKVNKAPPPPLATEGKAKTQILNRNTSNTCLHFFPAIGNSPDFDWGRYLDKETSVAASVSCFRHVST